MDLVADIKQRLSVEDLVGQYVVLRKSGRNFKALCPFHSEKTPSFYISVEKQIAYCFGCQKGGDLFQFFQEVENADFPTALKALAEKAGLDYTQYHATTQRQGATKDEIRKLADVHDIAVTFFKNNLWDSEEGAKVLDYLRGRGMSDETIRAWNVGFSPDFPDEFYRTALQEGVNKTDLIASGIVIMKDMDGTNVFDRFRMRLMFPIQDGLGRVVAFGGRALKKGMEPKYLNSPETAAYKKSEILYGLFQAKNAIRAEHHVIMVEGYMDLIACHQAGICEAVATSGTALTSEHAKILKRLTDTFYLCFDNDNAGWEATKRAYLVLQAVEANVRVVTIPDGKDPADTLKISKEPFVAAIAGARPFFDVYLDREISAVTLTPERTLLILTESLSYIRAVQNKILQDIAIRALAGRLGVKEVVIYDELKRVAQQQKFKPLDKRAIEQQRESISNNTSNQLRRLRPEELILVCALQAPPRDNPAGPPTKVPDFFRELHESDFPDDLREIFVAMREVVMKSQDLTISHLAEQLEPQLMAKISFYCVYGEAMYSEVSLEIFEKDVQTALDKLLQNRKNVQLEALKRIIKSYQQEGKKSELIEALAQLREKLKN